MRLIDKDTLIEVLGVMQGLCDTKAALIQNSKIWQQVKDMPTVDAVPVIRCKDCKHRPTLTDRECDAGFQYEFPDERCPCQCDDPWFNWMPADDWYCANAERKEDGKDLRTL